ncbi:hypothetical protein MMC34_001936 [Xylographa carneopallida]|nr:hypothetical protein [Xylographa carneopallida]
MAYNQNGQGYHRQQANSQGSGSSPYQYSSYYTAPVLQPQQALRRESSFDPGDDTTASEERRQNQIYDAPPGHSTYGTGYSVGAQYPTSQSPIVRNNSNSSTTNVGSQYYGSPSQSPKLGSHSSYNPQEYGRPQSHYSPQVYRTPSSSQSPGGYQPYVPAAYQATNTIPQPPYPYQAQEATLGAYGSGLPLQSTIYNSSLPALPYEQSFSQRISMPSVPQLQNHPPIDSYRHGAVPQIPTLATSAQRQSAYTPPAPPPPPLSPSRDAFPPAISLPIPTRSYTHDTSTASPTQSRSDLQRLPSLPNYRGGADYSTPTSSSRQSTSPRPSPNASLPPTPGPPPPQHSPGRTNTATSQHPQRRPLPGPPQLPYEGSSYFDPTNGEGYDGSEEQFGYDDIMKEVEAAVMGRPPTSSRPSPRMERFHYQAPINEEEEPQPLFSGTSQGHLIPDIDHTHTNGMGTESSTIAVNYSAYSDESDAEAAAGLAAMQLEEEREAADAARRRSGTVTGHSLYEPSQSLTQNPQQVELSSDSDVPVDLETYGSSFPTQLNYHYGNEQTADLGINGSSSLNYQNSTGGSTRRSNMSSEVLEADDSFFMEDDSIHPFPTFGARVDTGGTGGLSEPSAQLRRLSFEDDDEAGLTDSRYGDSSGAPSPARDPIYRSAQYLTRATSRPLPQLPGLMTPEYYRQRQPVDQFGRPAYPLKPDEYDQAYTPSGTPVQKSNSIGSHSTTPLVVPPGRSITDAEQRRRQQHSLGSRSISGYDVNIGSDNSRLNSAKYGNIDLPSIPAGRRKKFIPAKLSSVDFNRCSEPWALSSILLWIREMTEGEADLKEQAIVDGVVALFTHKVPTMNTADAEMLSVQVVDLMFEANALLKEEEWVKLGTQPVFGVLFQLTGTGCYSPRIHTTTMPGRCYAHHCMRTLKKINLQPQKIQITKKEDHWDAHYGVSKEDREKAPKKEVERQNILHEIVTSEDEFLQQMMVLTDLYRAGLVQSQQSIIGPKRLDSFLKDVFGKVDAVKKVNEDNLYSQLKYRQKEQGPWIVGFSDLFREWVRKAKTAFVEYAANFPNATLQIRREAERNVLFRQFLDQVQSKAESKRLGWDTYIKAPITRLQRYGLLLSTVLKATVQESAEKANLIIAIEEIRVVTHECDARVAEMSKRVDLADLSGKLKLRPGMEKVQLNLMHLGREIVFQGDLQRKGTNKVSWLDTHAILFDHFLVLSKPIRQRDAAGGLKHEVYDVSKLPIPMDLLVLDSTNDEPVVKSSVKGITSVSTVTSRVQTPQENRLGRTISNQNTTTGPGTLVHTNTGASTTSNSSSQMVTVIDSQNEKTIYPFRVKHLGKADVYVLFAPSAQNREEWCQKIIEAKTRHAASLFAQNAEPFRLRVMADAAFALDSMASASKSTVITGTPLDRAIREVEKAFEGAGRRPPPVCRAQVNCATAFNQPFGKHMVAIGTDYGVFVSEYGDPRGWSRAISASRVTQIAVLEEFSLLLVIADKSLIAYHLESVCPVGGVQAVGVEASARRAPQKLSGTRDIGFFATGRMKDRMLVFYKKKDGISSTFKVLEPVYHKSATTSRNRFGMRKGTTEYFRDYDEFYVPSETYAINLFHSSLAVATTKGFEVMTLDKKVPFSIPDLKGPDVASIASRVRDQRPLGMFRLTEEEFLLVFEEVGIYVNKFGDVSRAVVLEFVGKARQAVLLGGMYLILVDSGSGFVEVRNAVNGRLRQVVSGRDVRLLDDGGNGGTVKICMQHPEIERSQVVFEMIVNEGLKE